MKYKEILGYNSTLPKPKKSYYYEHKINGELMHKNTIVAKIVEDELQVINEKMLPSYFKLGGDLRHWLENRCIDMHRRNSRLLRKMLSIKTTNEIEVVLSVNAHTLTDNYWIRLNNNLKYEDISYSKDLLFDTSLTGDTSLIDSAELQNYNSPDLTLGGSFEKGWKLKDGKWYLVKAGNIINNSVELIASYLCEYFGFNHVKYYKFNEVCVFCENFTDNLKFDFEPMFDFLNDEEGFDISIDYISKINKSFVKDFLNMLFLDSILLNPDRHTNNYGLLRDSLTGEFIGLAPIFDNNLALFATKQNISNLDVGNKGQLEMFYMPILDEYNYKVPELNYDDLYKMVDKAYSDFKPVNYTVEFTTDFIWNKYNYIKDRLKHILDNLNL